MAKLLLSVDWGTTSFRLALVDRASGRVMRAYASDEGVQRISMRMFEDAGERATAFAMYLLQAVRQLQDEVDMSLAGVPIVLSGMVGSTIGWRPLPYASLPVGLDGQGLRTEWLEPVQLSPAEPANPVLLVSGLATGEEVLRGEEVEALGILHQPPYLRFGEAATLILPGTHSKHLEIRQRAVVNFRTYMTGELLAVLGQHSVLRHSVMEDVPAELSPDALRAGVDAARTMPLSRALFRVRTRQVLAQAIPEENHAFLIGVLVGAELYELASSGDACPILLGAGGRQALTYRLALDHLGLGAQVTSVAPEAMQSAVVTAHRIILQHAMPG